MYAFACTCAHNYDMDESFLHFGVWIFRVAIHGNDLS